MAVTISLPLSGWSVTGQLVFARHELQRDAVAGYDLSEVAMVEGGHGRDAEAFGDRYHGGVGGAEGERSVLNDQVGHAGVVGRAERIDDEFLGGKGAQKSSFGLRARLGEHVTDFGDDK